ncbi:hypothetical protein [Saccharolobus islandicus]|uniref:Uncharacterized protein n=2 Tax=Saccharolobus islandicus TaxID=43080 RepID=C3MWE2_SACI4|nr:hypothetical protein [Sulfolobus islandicus]ACP37600.1 conserved hypothetical protein [Sulfolobus islandicus M.14.25]ACP54743.1 conserved hypothetical protein [Sulfolobus islandicus M.16.27]
MIKIYSYEAKLFLFTITTLISAYMLSHYVLYLTNNNDINLLLNLVIYSVIPSIISLLYLEGLEAGKYFIIWYWTYFINSFFLSNMYHSPISLNYYEKLLLIPFSYSIISSIITSLIRIPRRKDKIESFPTLQIWFASVLYICLIILAKLFDFGLYYNILAISLLLSFINLGKERYSFNLSLLGLFVYSILISMRAHVGIDFTIIVFILALAYYAVNMRVIVIRNRDTVYGGVFISRYAILLFPIFLLIVWYLISKFLITIIPPINSETFPIIFLPSTLGNVIMDTVKGRKIGGIVGGIGMADGLWLSFLVCFIYYLLIIHYSFQNGTIIYLILSVIISILGI